jgi:hypothetical protein
MSGRATHKQAAQNPRNKRMPRTSGIKHYVKLVPCDNESVYEMKDVRKKMEYNESLRE